MDVRCGQAVFDEIISGDVIRVVIVHKAKPAGGQEYKERAEREQQGDEKWTRHGVSFNRFSISGKARLSRVCFQTRHSKLKPSRIFRASTLNHRREISAGARVVERRALFRDFFAGDNGMQWKGKITRGETSNTGQFIWLLAHGNSRGNLALFGFHAKCRKAGALQRPAHPPAFHRTPWVLDCGRPPPLFPEASQTVSMLTETAIFENFRGTSKTRHPCGCPVRLN